MPSDLLACTSRGHAAETGPGEAPRLEELVGGDGPARGGHPGLREAFENDRRKRRVIADDVGEGADIEDLADELGQHIVLAAQRPEQASERHIDADQDGAERMDVTAQQTEAAVEVVREGAQKIIDDVEVFHGPCPERGSGSVHPDEDLSEKGREV
jgi:hypothetical protein